jgi:hypothetical protein
VVRSKTDCGRFFFGHLAPNREERRGKNEEERRRRRGRGFWAKPKKRARRYRTLLVKSSCVPVGVLFLSFFILKNNHYFLLFSGVKE